MFVRYVPEQESTCLALIRRKLPDIHVAPNARADFADFLRMNGSNYLVALDKRRAVAAFAVLPSMPGRARLSWVMVAPDGHGAGLGRAMMEEAKTRAAALSAGVIDVGASHLSAAFFSRFGAREVGRIENGWGPNMHR